MENNSHDFNPGKMSDEECVELVNQCGGNQSPEAFRKASKIAIRLENRSKLLGMCEKYGRGMVYHSAAYLKDQYFQAEVAGSENIIKGFFTGDPNEDEHWVELARMILNPEKDL